MAISVPKGQQRGGARGYDYLYIQQLVCSKDCRGVLSNFTQLQPRARKLLYSHLGVDVLVPDSFVQFFTSLTGISVLQWQYRDFRLDWCSPRVGSGSGDRVAIFYTVQQQCRRVQTNEPSIDCNNPFPSHYPPLPPLHVQLQSSDYSLKGNAKSFGTTLQVLHFCRLI